jgi:hypothetical protein
MKVTAIWSHWNSSEPHTSMSGKADPIVIPYSITTGSILWTDSDMILSLLGRESDHCPLSSAGPISGSDAAFQTDNDCWI